MDLHTFFVDENGVANKLDELKGIFGNFKLAKKRKKKQIF